MEDPSEHNDLKEAEKYLMEGDLESAKELYEKVLADDPDNWRALNGMGLITSGSDSQANLSFFKRAVDNCFDTESPFINLGVSYSKLGQNQKALEAWELGIERLGKGKASIHLLQALGLEYLYSVNNLEKAEDYFRSAMEIEPENGDFLYYMGIIHEEKGVVSEAEKYYVLSKTFNAYGNLGLLYRSQNRLQDSIKAFHSALEIEENYLIRFSLAAIYNDLGDEERAIANIKAGLTRYPHSGHVKRMLKKMAEVSKNQEAITELLSESESSGRTYRKAVPVNNVKEEYEIIRDDCCPICFSRLDFIKQSLYDKEGKYYDKIETVCSSCGKPKDFWFFIGSFFP